MRLKPILQDSISCYTIFPAIFFGRSDRCWWVFVSFLRHQYGVRVYADQADL